MIGSNKHDENPLIGEHEEEMEELWLISYADLMTLLFTFFVVMYTMSMVKTSSQESMREAMTKAFGGSYTPPQEKLLKKLSAAKKENEFMAKIDFEPAKDGLEITFRSSLLFKRGKAELLPETKGALDVLVEAIREHTQGAEILVGGHTDSLPMRSKMYPSNWELSSARAAQVVRAFVRAGYDPEKLIVMGYGASRPAYADRDKNNNPIEENMRKNRRVTLKVVSKGMVRTPSSSGK